VNQIVVKKTYVAILNGIPFEDKRTSILSVDAYNLGVDVDPNDDESNVSCSSSLLSSVSSSSSWQLIDHPLDGKSAITLWRVLQYVPSVHATDETLTMIEMKPQTGRFHQLRRHASWVLQKPILGDTI
jgi:23S rRNA-/tRNA-specific pseudouridylate synthase